VKRSQSAFNRHTPAGYPFSLIARLGVLLAALILLLVVCRDCRADALPDSLWLNLGGVSVHSKGGLNNVNPALALEARWGDEFAITGGQLRNSQSARSHFLAAIYTPWSTSTPLGTLRAGITVGAIDGYTANHGRAIPVAGATAALTVGPVELGLLGVPASPRSTAVITLMVKVRLQ
jgi:hypothetical protein